MLEKYFTIKEMGSAELEVKKSRFICSLERVKTEEEAKTFIQEIKKAHWKANHNCSAFVLGDHMEIQRSSDDGEPSGTAGIPMLEVLKKNELINVVCVVTRYFGGIKLGTGGLIRAYSHAVSSALKEVGIVEGRLQKEVSFSIAYPLLGKLQNYLEASDILVKDTLYTEAVKVVCMVDEPRLDEITEKVTDLLNGQVEVVAGESSYAEVLVSGSAGEGN